MTADESPATQASFHPIKIGEYTLDTRKNVLSRGDRDASLSPQASRCLQILAKRPNEVVTRNDIIAGLWSGNHLIGDPGLNRVISELRKALGDDPRTPKVIQTVPRQGYRLISETLGIPPAEAPRGFRWRFYLTVFLIVLFAAIIIHWLLELAIGLAWTLKHST